MQFKEFITRQRAAIFIVGIVVFVISLIISHNSGFNTIAGELFVDLAASSVTIVFTALIIDYLHLREERNRTKNAANLAMDEIHTTCIRIEWRIARMYGMQRNAKGWDDIHNRKEAKDYLEAVTDEVSDFLTRLDFKANKSTITLDAFRKYIERLATSQTELEQALILYEYALPYGLRERVLALRSELQTAERLLNFVDNSDSLTKANLSLIAITAQSVYEAIGDIIKDSPRRRVLSH